MKTWTTVILLAILPSLCHGQSDLKKILRGVQQFQQMQRQQGEQQGQQIKQPPQDQVQGMQAPVQGPNMSGNQNRGDFSNNFLNGNNSNFNPQRGNVIYPQNGGGQNPQFQNGQGNFIYPNQNRINGQTYPPGTIINGQPYRPGQQYQPGLQYQPGQTYPPGTIINGQPYQPGQGQITSRISYPDPPVAPKRSYSLQPIIIRCADNATGICNYELMTESGKAFPYTISAGRSQQLQETTAWTFRYKPTPTAASTSYRLRGGKTYEIRRNGNTWQLYMAP